MNIDEKQLIKKIRHGSEEAYDILFDTYYQGLVFYALRYVDKTEIAEEIVQDLFVYVWEKKEELRIHTSLKSYLYMSVRNDCYDHLKHLQVEKRYEARIIREQSSNEMTSDSDESLMESELKTHVEKAIETLPPKCRQIFELSRFEELKYKEIAKKLDLSVKTIEVQIGKALKILREQLKDYLMIAAFIINFVFV
jgi:RNA polymerase sigma-70 factor, ECF subfamily